MNATSNRTILGRFLDPVTECLTPEVAAKIAALRASPADQARIEELAEKNSEGTITPEERDEYADMVLAVNMVSVLQAKARAALRGG